jgi:hypothetical protein
MGELPALYKPVKMATGITAHASWQAAADSATLIASLSVCCRSGLCDIFHVTAVDGTNTELVNKDGATIGQALAGQQTVKMSAVYPAGVSMNENGGGVSSVWIESPEGQIKGLIPTASGYIGSQVAPSIDAAISLTQNDRAFVNTDT